jgi:hypothetical protein
MGEGRNVYRVFLGNPEGKGPLKRPRRRWEDGIKLDLRETGGVRCRFIWLRIGTVAGCCECGDEPSVSGTTELVSA